MSDNPSVATAIEKPPTSPQGKAPKRGDLKHLLRMKVPVIVRLARKSMSVGTVLCMAPGAIIEFDKRADQELELMIRNKTIGFGKAVKIGEQFGLKVTSICDVHETIRILGG
jgi:flagellar motor switch protein FliN/FliY